MQTQGAGRAYIPPHPPRSPPLGSGPRRATPRALEDHAPPRPGPMRTRCRAGGRRRRVQTPAEGSPSPTPHPQPGPAARRPTPRSLPLRLLASLPTTCYRVVGERAPPRGPPTWPWPQRPPLTGRERAAPPPPLRFTPPVRRPSLRFGPSAGRRSALLVPAMCMRVFLLQCGAAFLAPSVSMPLCIRASMALRRIRATPCRSMNLHGFAWSPGRGPAPGLPHTRTTRGAQQAGRTGSMREGREHVEARARRDDRGGADPRRRNRQVKGRVTANLYTFWV